jgi:hypothetical protein
MPRIRKEAPSLSLPPLTLQKPNPESSVPAPEEPKFYGEEFAALMSTYRKSGTLREKNVKRAGLTKGLRLTSHVHANVEDQSIADIPLVILDCYHGRLDSIYRAHPLAFLLDGITSETEAIRVLQNFSQNTIRLDTKIDYFTFTYESLFDALSEKHKTRLLSLPIEQAIIDPAFAHLFYPSLCQALVWHGHGVQGWIDFLKNIKAIDTEKAEAWRQTINTLPSAVHTDLDLPGLLQEILDDFDPLTSSNPNYRLFVLGQLDAYDQRTEALTSRWVLRPCRGRDSNHGNIYAVCDQAAADAILKWIDEQEAEVLVMDTEKSAWDQKYSLAFIDSELLCPDCQET